MKILIVNASFYPVINGHVIYMENIAKSFIKQGHEVDLLCSGENKNNKLEGINLIRYEKPLAGLSPQENYEEYRKRSFTKLKKLDYKKYDLIISGSEIFLEDLKKLYSSDKIIWAVPSLRNVAENVADKKEAKRLKEQIQTAIKKIKLVVVSELLKNQFKEHFGREDNIEVVYPGIDLNKFEFKKEKNEDNILFIGRICKEKNVESLINGFKLSEKGKLIIVGGGNTDKLKEKLKGNGKEKMVSFEGVQKETKQYYDKSKIFVLPSIYESFGHVILEAMASGLVVIAFKPNRKNVLTASNEIIEDGKTGFLVNSEKEMAEQIDLILNNEELRISIINKARRKAESFSWNKTAQEILNFAGIKDL